MRSIEPTDASIELAALLPAELCAEARLRRLQITAGELQALVPDCLGITVEWFETGMSFTVTASPGERAVLAALSHLSSDVQAGSASPADDHPAAPPHVLDEPAWRAAAQHAAATGVRHSITMPMLDGAEVLGAAHLYAASDNAFEDHHQQIADLLGASDTGATRNADLSFSSRSAPVEALDALLALHTRDTATTLLMETRRLDACAAHEMLETQARRAGLTIDQLAQGVISVHAANSRPAAED